MPLTLSVKDLPSKGKNYSIDVIRLSEASFRDLIIYDKYKCNTYIQKLYRDIEFISKDIGDLKQISAFDLDAIIFTKKMISISESPEVNITTTCPFCDKSQNVSASLSDYNYTDVSSEVFSIAAVDLAGEIRKVEVPNVQYIKECCEKFMAYNEDVDPRIFTVSTLLGFLETPLVKSIVEGCKKSEILIVDKISKLMSGSMKYLTTNCTSCRKEFKINIGESSSNMFQLLELNTVLPEDKIIFESNIQPGHY